MTKLGVCKSVTKPQLQSGQIVYFGASDWSYSVYLYSSVGENTHPDKKQGTKNDYFLGSKIDTKNDTKIIHIIITKNYNNFIT